MANWTLVIRRGEGAGGEYPLDGELVLGREPGPATVVLADPGISRRHAVVHARGGRVSIEDLGSANGTFVNGRRIRSEIDLADGDEIELGATLLSVTASGGAPTAAPVRRPPAPGRLAPRPDAQDNVPALAAAFLGPLSILLLLFSSGAAFFVALPCAIAAIVLGNLGIRRVDRGEAGSHRTLARLGRIAGIAGAVLSALAIVAYVVVAAALDATEDSLDGIVERVREEIE